MNDLQQRLRVIQDRDWTKPSGMPLWPAFEAVVIKLLMEWDVMKMAVEGGWSDGDSLYERAKVIDDALANFSQRAAHRTLVEPIEVNTFLVGSMDDRFNADIEFNTAASVSSILVKVFDEVRQGNTTGLRQILGDEVCEAVTAHGEPFAMGGAEPSAPPPAVSYEGSSAQVQAQSSAGPDEDGWETVAKPRRSKRVQQQYAVTSTLQQDSPNAAQAQQQQMQQNGLQLQQQQQQQSDGDGDDCEMADDL